MNKPTTKSNYQSNPFLVVFKGFEKLFKYNQTWSIILIVLGLLGSAQQIIDSSSGATAGNSASSEMSGAVVAVIIVGVLLFIVLVIIFSVLYNGAVTYVAWKTMHNHKAGVKEALLAAKKKFWTLLWLDILVGLRVLGGLILFIIPGIRAMLRYQMVRLPVFIENKSAKESIEDMKILTKDHLLELFGQTTAASIIPIVSPVLALGSLVVMYPQLRELKESGAPKPPVHWLNYFGFILGILLTTVIVLIVLLIMAVVSNS